MLSLVHLAIIAGALSLSVRGAAVLDGRQLRGPGPVNPGSSHPTISTESISSTTDILHFSSFSTEAASTQSTVQATTNSSTGITQESSHSLPQATRGPKIFTPPLFTPLPIGTASVKRPIGGEQGATVEVNGTTTAGSPVATDATATALQLAGPVFTKPIMSEDLTPKETTATLLTASAVN
ncbi:uncharacterized protein EV420DRAFT_1578224 [Desarmillaria tabescens]|uniref:Uncharacterized protein n=1 Tax=Armillaria tabescens TaxID=1929756 RepID=A0AA39MQN3_ARMTA|nr:uncharacterized protein EV420DRAFT_1578224 [Desarmillaria tabescens]KAK0442489.1 hypothetical protein EV420DRAFT_1578224 [Desarmillaria tabescens]